MSDADKERVLAQFQRKAQDIKAIIATQDEAYEAFKVVDRRQLCVHICPLGEPIAILKYSYMLYALAAPSGRRLDLTFSFMLVTIKGRNLQALADAVGDERCVLIQQFDPKTWPKPKDDSAPLIEAIDCITHLPTETARFNEASERPLP